MGSDSAPGPAPLGPGLLGAGPGYPSLPAYHQLAAAQRLASIHRTLLGSASPDSQVTHSSHQGHRVTTHKSPLQVAGPQENKKRTRATGGGAQFSIDELLRQDDKRSKFETDSKSISVGEVEPREGEEDEVDVSSEDVTIKEEMEIKATSQQD